MFTYLFLGLLAGFGALYAFLGIRASRSVKTEADYYLGNRSLGFWQITCNLIATQLGGGMLIGTAEEAYMKGLYGLLYTLGMGLGLLLLAGGVAARLQQFKVTTAAELFGMQYKSDKLRKIASLLSIITLFGILVTQAISFRKLLCGIGFADVWISNIFWLSVIGYTMIGGLRAITINDMVQLCIIVTVFGSLFVGILWQNPTSITTLFSAQANFIGTTPSFMQLIPIALLPALFSLFQQDLAQRFFAARSMKVAASAALSAGIFLLLFSIVPVYFGMQAKFSGLNQANGSVLLQYISQNANQFMFALVVCAIIAAIISTADALINALSANITNDFDWKIAGNRKLVVAKLVSGAVGLAALVMSYLMPSNIIGLMIDSYAISVCCLIVPMMYGIYQKKCVPQAAYCAIAGGLIAFITFSVFNVGIAKELLALIFSWISYQAGIWIWQRKKLASGDTASPENQPFPSSSKSAAK